MSDVFTDLLRIPAADVGPSPRDWSARYLAGGIARLSLDAGAYSQPQYQGDGTKVRVFPRWGRGGWFPNGPITVDIPKGALPSSGTDGQMDIRTPAGVWSLWGYIGPGMTDWASGWARGQAQIYNLLKGYVVTRDAIASSVTFTPTGATGNGTLDAPAYPLYAGTGLATEAAAGLIPHALAMTVPATISMNGPKAPATITDVNDAAIGTTHGAASSPARYLETTEAKYPVSGQVPDGTRSAIRVTDAEIAQWIQGRGYTGATAILARIFAVCLRDYGLVQTQTGGHWAVTLDGSYTAAKAWKEMGLRSDLLAGLVTPERLWTLRSPVSVGADGRTFTREGAAVTIGY